MLRLGINLTCSVSLLACKMHTLMIPCMLTGPRSKLEAKPETEIILHDCKRKLETKGSNCMIPSMLATPADMRRHGLRNMIAHARVKQSNT